MSSLPANYLSPEEYLAIERAADHKSEYHAGEMYAMAGGSREHSLIAGNIFAELHRQLKGRPCEPHGSDLRVRVSATGLYTYPDGSVACGEIQYEDGRRDTLLNPTVIVEVLSESTEAYDRGGKWRQYQTIPSLREYLLVAQDRPSIEKFTRIDHSGDWTYSVYEGLDAVVDLPSIGSTLPLREVYDRITFDFSVP